MSECILSDGLVSSPAVLEAYSAGGISALDLHNAIVPKKTIFPWELAFALS